jgi:hypothetical protein
MNRRYASDDDPEDMNMFDDDWTDSDGRDSQGNFPSARQAIYMPTYRYRFQTEEELITSEIFQRCLGKALALKDKEIAQLRQELMNRLFSDL